MSSETRNVTWTIGRATIGSLPTQDGTLTYNGTTNDNGTAQTPSWTGYDATKMTLTVTAQANAGTYTATFTPLANYQWWDGTTTSKSAEWVIERQSIDRVTASSTAFDYDGSTHIPTFADYNANTSLMSGTTAAQSAVGNYATMFTPLSNFQWNSGSDTTGTITIAWNIVSTAVSLPTQSGTLTYSKSQQEPSWNNYNSAQLTIGGVTQGTNAGTYIATFTPNTGYTWAGGGTEARNAEWVIDKAKVTLPTQTNTLTYDGTVQEPVWSAYDPDALTLGGVTQGTDAGDYTATFTPTANYEWA